MFDEELITDSSIYSRSLDVGGQTSRAVKTFIKNNPGSEHRSKKENLQLFICLIKNENLSMPSDDALMYIFSCSEKTLSRAKSAVASTETPPESPKRGAPPKFPITLMPKLISWVKEKTLIGEPPTRQELGMQADQILIDNGLDIDLSYAWIDSLLRSKDSPFKKIKSVPLEEERFNVTAEEINKWIKLLIDVNIVSYDPRLVINLDETGFGSSSNSRAPKLTVIVCKEEEDNVNYMVPRTDQHVTAIVAISAKGEMLKPALIHRNKTLAHDAEKCFFFKGAYYYQSKNAFVNKGIYEDYIKRELIPRISEVYAELPEEQQRAVLLVDGHTSHFSKELLAVLAEHNIAYLCMPSHSSHILQPLDRHFFAVVKKAFRSKTIRADVVAHSALLERCYTALLSAATPPTIVTSFVRAGIIPIMRGGEVAALELSPDKVLHSQWGIMSEYEDENEEIKEERKKEKGKRIKVKYSDWGLMNEQQRKRQEENKCPFCGKPLGKE